MPPFPQSDLNMTPVTYTAINFPEPTHNVMMFILFIQSLVTTAYNSFNSKLEHTKRVVGTIHSQSSTSSYITYLPFVRSFLVLAHYAKTHMNASQLTILLNTQ